ncbi:protein PFC0760c-like isoform X2 [Nerophis ophidion]|nr:protein PFC0760c-like isoform X2 [Nerophis ophidion]XP_061739336.1 protein PFC0760c-like isoform X2 [Nerophis ophidion]XP_061739341.1 protein PFC0760c-like isoform X2 [Nerophis ophidion]XP_061739350.1 protein PFC0760c-like isoform X2 [Nerophis ophidion]
MDGQGDGDHNGPNRYRMSMPIGDLPSDSDDDDDDDDDNDDHDDGGDEEDVESVFLMHLIVNHYMRFFVNPRAELQHHHNTDDINNVYIENNRGNFDDIIEHEDEMEVAVGSEAELGVNNLMDEEEEPQPGPSRNRSRDDDEEEDELRSSSRYFRWWHEFDNSSDGSTDLDADEQDAQPGGSKKRSRDDQDENLRLQGDLSLMTLSGHHAHAKNSVMDEQGASKMGDYPFVEPETAEDALLLHLDERARESYDKEKCGKKRFKK